MAGHRQGEGKDEGGMIPRWRLEEWSKGVKVSSERKVNLRRAENRY